MTTTTLNIAAACLFDEAGRLLPVRKCGTRPLMLPGGMAEPGGGGDARAVLKRELVEQLSLRLAADALSHLGQFQAPAANEANTWIDASVFRAQPPHVVSPTAELEELRWLPVKRRHRPSRHRCCASICCHCSGRCEGVETPAPLQQRAGRLADWPNRPPRADHLPLESRRAGH